MNQAPFFAAVKALGEKYSAACLYTGRAHNRYAVIEMVAPDMYRVISIADTRQSALDKARQALNVTVPPKA